MATIEQNESRRYGRRLADHLAAGQPLAPVAVPMALQPGERCFGQTTLQLWQFLEGNGTYTHTSGFFWGGGLVATGVVAGAMALGNRSRRERARREAAPQWRAVEQGNLFVTDRRLAMQLGGGWNDLWFSSIRMSECDGTQILVEADGWARTAIRLPYADYWFVLLQYLAYGRVVVPPPPDDVPPVPQLAPTQLPDRTPARAPMRAIEAPAD